jgi:NADH-quinone oxidoreductase subunit N
VTVLAADSIHAPSIAYGALTPVLILFGAACAGVLVEAFTPRPFRHAAQAALALLSLLASFIAVIAVAEQKRPRLTAAGALSVDNVALFTWGSLAAMGLIATLLLAERQVEAGVSPIVAQAGVTAGTEADRRQTLAPYAQTEIFPLALFALAGMMVFTASNNLLLAFVALEVFSLPLYLMCGLARRRRLLSQEAAVKYFLLGAFASAFFLYGVALLYGYANSVNLRAISAATAEGTHSDLLFFLGLAMLLIGLLFKAGIAPFHSWKPDVYQGAPTAVTALMSSATVTAAFGALMRFLYVPFRGMHWDWRPAVAGAAVVTLFIGSVVAVTQTDIKRLLAYSSIANAGYLLTGILGLNKQGIGSTLFYLATYGLTTLGAFAVVTLVRTPDGEANHLSQWAGLAKRSPLFAAVFTLFLLAFAGIPLTSGFTGKFAVFQAAADGGMTWLIVAGVVSSMILAFPYLRVVVLMYLSESKTEGVATAVVPGMATSLALTLGVVGTLLFGVVPGPLLDLANHASRFLA